MQTTLLSVALAIILALVAALVAPFYVDWNQYRPFLEAKATALIGQPVRITGPIDARLLPAPTVKLHAVEIGPAADPNRVRARSLDIEFSLGALLRGKVQAVEMRVRAPEFTLAMDKSGRVSAGLSIGFNPGAVAIERLNIEEGRAILLDGASGGRVVLEQVSFNGDLRSLIGPFKGDGAFVLGGQFYPYRIATGRLGEDGSKLRLSIDAVFERPYTIEAEGTLTISNGAPGFEGTLAVARPHGIALPNGQTLVNDPWSMTSRVNATPAGAKFEQVEFRYGAEEAGVRLSGSAQLTLGAKPLLNAVLTGRQLDLDRFIATDAPGLPLAALKTVAETFAGGLRPPLRTELGISVDAMTLGGATVQGIRGDLVGDAESWSLDKLEFRSPGYTQVRMSGRLGVRASGAHFTGPVDIETTDAKTLVNWLAGAAAPPAGLPKSWHARGKLSVGGGSIAIDGLKTEFDRESLEGHIAYTAASGDRPPRLAAEIKAADLDLDAVQAFAGSALAGSGLQWPREVVLAADIERLKYAGVDARRVNAKLRFDADGAALDRVSVGDFGGAALQANGRIDQLTTAARGTITIDLDARNLGGLTALLEKWSPEAAEPMQRVADRLAPAKLRATLSVASAPNGAGPATKLAVDGRLGAMRVNIAGEAASDPMSLDSADVRLDARVDADDGAALLALAGLQSVIALEKTATRFDVSATGLLTQNLTVRGRMQGGGLDAAATGTLRLFGADSPRAILDMTAATADARPLWRGSGKTLADRLPIDLKARVALTGNGAAFEDLSGRIVGTNVRGKLGMSFGPPRVSGDIEIDRVDGAAFVAAGIGMPASSPKPTTGTTVTTAWPLQPFGSGLFAGLDATIAFKAREASVGSSLMLRQARGTLRINASELAFEEVEGDLAGGRFNGQITFHPVAGGINALAQVALKDADAAALVTADGTPVTGKLGLRAEVSGTGLSPAALVASLGGAGTITLTDGQLAGLNPGAFATATQVADRSGSLEVSRVRDLIGAALDDGRLRVAQAEADVTVSGGEVRLAAVTARTDGADLTAAGHLTLSDNALDGRLTLSGLMPRWINTAPEVSILLKGPVWAPKRTIDVSALVGWLTLRSVEQQSRKLDAIESGRPESALEDDSQNASVVPAITGNLQLPRPRPNAAPHQAASRKPEPVATASTGTPNTAETRPQTQTANALPETEELPPLSPPIEIRPAPGAGERKPQARPRAAAKPASVPAPAPSRSIFNLFDSHN